MGSSHRRELARRGTCPECGEEKQRLAGHWKGPCSPILSREQRDFLAGLLLGNGFVGGNGQNKHFQLSTRWRPFARWVFAELGWLAMSIVRVEDGRKDQSGPAQRYVVRTHAHSVLTQFRAWYDTGDEYHTDSNEVDGSDVNQRALPPTTDLPASRLTPRAGRAWHATAGSLGWSNPEYATTRQASFSAEADDRAERVIALLESVGLDPTRAGKRVQLPPKQTTAWLEWIGDDPVPGVRYKWAATVEEYRDAKNEAETFRAELWANPDKEPATPAFHDG